MLFRTLGTPANTYREICNRTPDFNKLASFKVLSLSSNRAELSFSYRDPSQHGPEHPFVCDNRRGQIASLPRVWGLPLATVEELECGCRGGRQCHYRVQWVNRAGNKRGVLLGLAAGGLAWALGAASGAEPLAALVPLAAACGFTIWKTYALSKASREQLDYARLQSEHLGSSVRDIERKYDELARAQNEIQDLNVNLEKKVDDRTAELKEALEKLKQLDRFKSQFFANITHELKTPLAMILSPLELMVAGEMGRIGEEQAVSLQSMLRNAMKLLKLIEDLLDLSKLEESRIRLRVAEQDLVVYLRNLVGQIDPLAQRKKIELRFHCSLESCAVHYDPDRMERVFLNLLANAAKFTPEGGQITVRLEDADDRVLVTVTDNGPGFPADKAEQIFERFFQVDMGGTRRYGGAGIGLALARELVELHGGRIWASSQPGQGASFFVELHKGREHFRPEALDRRGERRDVASGKRVEDQGITDWAGQLAARHDYRFLDFAEATERRVVERDVHEDERPFTVLVVEDTPDVIRLVHLSLRRHFRVIAAEDGLKGWEFACKQPPNLVITDLMMPGIDGHELTRRLRADARTKHIPIVMLTARGDLEDRLAGRESGVNVYLTKPFSPRELLSTARTLLDIQETHADLLMTQKLDSLERVAAGLAHEINNPLNYVVQAVEFFRKDSAEVLQLVRNAAGREPAAAEARLTKLEARIQRMLGMAETGLQRIGSTVELMKKYSREGYSRQPVPHDVFAALQDVVHVVVPSVGREVKLEIDLQGEGWVECVPEEVHQVLTNLVQNALEAVPEDTGLIRLQGRVEQGHVLLFVADNGPGMPPEVRQRIFSPFFTTKGPGRGMGLGLTISWRVVKSLGGTIDVKSAPGAGTEFAVKLPATSRPAVLPES
ncbi:MAG: response regulator [Deltaproteobacteria bacterium]|nr:response regulator [Deltaproteobacteria bacterium]